MPVEIQIACVVQRKIFFKSLYIAIILLCRRARAKYFFPTRQGIFYVVTGFEFHYIGKNITISKEIFNSIIMKKEDNITSII